MFGTPKPSASLTSGLLARKGHARPAMRPQGYLGVTASPGDDLGWNDMGDDGHGHNVHQHIQPVPQQPIQAPPPGTPPVLRQRAAIEESFAPDLAPEQPAFEAPVLEDAVFEAAEPVFEAEESVIEAPVFEPELPEAAFEPAPEPLPQPVPVKARAPRIAPAVVQRVAREISDKKGKAAFTLRLDADRHLRLRLASALRNQSAQLLVTEALDQFLDSLTEVDALARQVGAGQGRD